MAIKSYCSEGSKCMWGAVYIYTRLKKKTLKDVGMACQKVCEQGRDNA